MRSARGIPPVIAATLVVTLSACTGRSSGGTAAPTSPFVLSSSATMTNGTATTASDYRAELARPLHLPTLRSGQPCPTSRGTRINTAGFAGVAIGPGPVHPLGAVNASGVAYLSSRTQHPGWLAFKSLWFSEPRYQGPFLVRIRRLDGAGPAGVLDDPRSNSFYVSAGPTLNGTDGYRQAPGATWVKSPACIAWQVDGSPSAPSSSSAPTAEHPRA